MATGETWVVEVTTSVEVELPPTAQRIYPDCPQAEAMMIARKAVAEGKLDEFVVQAVALFTGQTLSSSNGNEPQ